MFYINNKIDINKCQQVHSLMLLINTVCCGWKERRKEGNEFSKHWPPPPKPTTTTNIVTTTLTPDLPLEAGDGGEHQKVDPYAR